MAAAEAAAAKPATNLNRMSTEDKAAELQRRQQEADAKAAAREQAREVTDGRKAAAAAAVAAAAAAHIAELRAKDPQQLSPAEMNELNQQRNREMAACLGALKAT